MKDNELTEKVIGCAIEVHKTLGPGLLESAYEKCLSRELSLSGIMCETQVSMPVEYKGTYLDCGYRVDMLVEKQVILELKNVDKVTDIHRAQLLTYMRLAKIKLGLIINFNVKLLKLGIERFVL